MDETTPAKPLDTLKGLVVRLEGKRIQDLLAQSPLAGQLVPEILDPDEVLFRDGDEGNTAYLVLEGSLDVIKGIGSQAKILGVLGEGDVVGEMALMDLPVRSATVRAGSDGARLITLSREIFHLALAKDPELSTWLLKVLSHRLRLADQRYATMENAQKVQRRILEGQEVERQRIARAIHDGPAQYFADYTMRLQIIEKLMDRDLDRARGEIQDLKGRLQEGLEKLRGLIRSLQQSDLRSKGLEQALRAAAPEGVLLHFDFDEDYLLGLGGHLQSVLLLLGSEAIETATQSFQAANVRLSLVGGPERCTFEIEDDGVGFDPHTLFQQGLPQKSLGLTSMKERIELAGGRLLMRSQPAAGTTLRFLLPVPQNANPA